MIGRTIRPRPLSYTERIPVVFLSRPKDIDDDSQPVDPALEQFLQNCEDLREKHGLLGGLESSQGCKKNRHHRAAQQQQLQQPPHPQTEKGVRKVAANVATGRPRGSRGLRTQHKSDAVVGLQRAPGASAAAPSVTPAAAIAVPTWREICDYGSNEEAMAKADARKAAEAGPSVPLVGLLLDVSPCLTTASNLGLDAAAYIIYQDIVRDQRAEPALLQYDMDEVDDKALTTINAALAKMSKPGAAGLSKTPLTTRASTAAAAAVAAAMLDEDGFEAVMGALEAAHFEALQQLKELWQAEVKAGKVPSLPVEEKVLPWKTALAALKQHHPPLPRLPRALYNYWLKRRKQEGGPLLQYLWYEQPWKAICFQDREPGHEGEQGDMPFMATETKNSTRGGWNRIRIDKKEAYERLMAVRDEFELLRTTADQVRKRERLKKQRLKLYRAELAAKLGLTLYSKHAAAAQAGGAGLAGTVGPSAAAAAGGRGLDTSPTARPPRRFPLCDVAASGKATVPSLAADRAVPARDGNGDEPPNKRRRVAADAPAAAPARWKVFERVTSTRVPEAVVDAEMKTKQLPKARHQAATAPSTTRAGRGASAGTGKQATQSLPPRPASWFSSSSSCTSTSSDLSSSESETDASPESKSDKRQMVEVTVPGIAEGRRRPAAGGGAAGRDQGIERMQIRQRPQGRGRKGAVATVGKALAAVTARGAVSDALSVSSGSSSSSEEEEEVSDSGNEDEGGSLPESSSSSLPPQSTSSPHSSDSGKGQSSRSHGSTGSGSGSEGGESEDEGAKAGTGLPSASLESLSSSEEGSSEGEEGAHKSSEEGKEDKHAHAARGCEAEKGERLHANLRSQSRPCTLRWDRAVRRAVQAQGGSGLIHTCGDEIERQEQPAGAGGIGEGKSRRQGMELSRTKRFNGRCGRESVAEQQQQQQPPPKRPRTRSRSALCAAGIAAAAAAASVPSQSASAKASSSSDTTRTSSPTRSSRSRHEQILSSSPEPSRSLLCSPRRLRHRRCSAPAAGGTVPVSKGSGLAARVALRRKLAVAAGNERQGIQKKAKIRGRSLEQDLAKGGDRGLKVPRPNRELLALLRMQSDSTALPICTTATPSNARPASAANIPNRMGGMAGHPQPAVGEKDGLTAAAAPLTAATATKAQPKVQPARPIPAGYKFEEGGTARETHSAGERTALLPRSAIVGNKRPLEPHEAAAGTNDDSPSPKHKKTNIGWRKEVAGLLGKPFLMTSRFLLRRMQHQPRRIVAAAAVAAKFGKGREGRNSVGGNTGDLDASRGSTRRTSMLRERNGSSM